MNLCIFFFSLSFFGVFFFSFTEQNLLEDRLKHSNSAVVLGTTKVFLNFTQSLPKVHEEVYKRLKAPLLTLMGSGSHELSFTVLSHVDLLVNRAPHIYEDSYKHFFVRFNDASCVKLQKLSIISSLVNNKNFSDILNELAEYVTDIDPDISRFAIRCKKHMMTHERQARTTRPLLFEASL